MKYTAAFALLSASVLYASSSVAAPRCSIEIHPRFNLYVINVDGRPFKNKHYVDYGDAALLQRVLVDAGHCVPTQKIAKCKAGNRSSGEKKVLLAGGASSSSGSSKDSAGLTWSSTDCSTQ